MTISDEHRALNVELHQRDPGFGGGGHKWATRILQLTRVVGAFTVLDYGCGKGSLRIALGQLDPKLDVREFDPGIPGKDEPPHKADLVVCTDVLEHVEPDQLDAVISDVRLLSIRAALIAVACRPGKRGLADGRDEHLIVQPPAWWAKRLGAYGFIETTPLRRDKEYAALYLRKPQP